MRAGTARRMGGVKRFYLLAAVSLAAHNGDAQAGLAGENAALQSEERVAPIPQQNISKYLAQVLAKSEADLTDRDKMVLRRAKKLNVQQITESAMHDKEFFEQLDQVKSLRDVQDSDSTLTVPVRHDQKGSFWQVMHFDKEELSRIRSWLMSIDDAHIRQAFPGPMGEDLVAQKLLSPNDYVRSALVQIANKNETIRKWLFRSADAHHPLWEEDGRLKEELLPEGWTKIYFKGSGWAPILKEDLHLAERLQESYFWKKVYQANPTDRRNMAKEYDIRRNPNGWVFDMIARKFNAIRPSDLDKDYFFDLEADVPFEDCLQWQPDKQVAQNLNDKFLVKDPVIGRILGNVPQQTGPVPALSRKEIMELCFRAKLVKTVAEGGDYDAPETEKKSALQSETA